MYNFSMEIKGEQSLPHYPSQPCGLRGDGKRNQYRLQEEHEFRETKPGRWA